MNRAIHRFLIAAAIAIAALPYAPAEAGIISTQDALAMADGQALERVETWLMRDDVRRELAQLGVDPELARLRAAALSPAELEELAGRLEEAPAGAGVLEVIGATFVVLLVLELLGVINIFNR